MILAVLCATLMWYMVSVRDRREAQVEVNLDYYGIPPNLVVTKGLVSKLIVRLRGPETLLRSIPSELLHQAINLSSIKKGENIVPLGGGEIPNFRAFDVIDIQPPRIEITADTIMERSVRVTAKVESPLGGDALTIEGVSVNPATVILRGPEQTIAKLSEITVEIRADAKSVGRQQDRTITLDTPSLVTASPPSVQVRYIITSGRTVLSRSCPVVVAGDYHHDYITDPKEFTVLVEVPDALARDEKYLKQLEATVVPPALDPGKSIRLKPKLRLPEGMSLTTPLDREVLVSRKKAGS